MSDQLEAKIGELTVRIDRLSCVGSANCAKVAPDLFIMDDEDTAAFAPGSQTVAADKVLDACRVCPVEALLVANAAGEKLVP